MLAWEIWMTLSAYSDPWFVWIPDSKNRRSVLTVTDSVDCLIHFSEVCVSNFAGFVTNSVVALPHFAAESWVVTPGGMICAAHQKYYRFLGVKRTKESSNIRSKIGTNELSYSCSNCKVWIYTVHVHDCAILSPYILHCRRCAVRQHVRTLNLRPLPPCMLWDGVHVQCFDSACTRAQHRKSTHSIEQTSMQPLQQKKKFSCWRREPEEGIDRVHQRRI